MLPVRMLTAEEIASSGFRRLLWYALEVPDAELDRVLREDLPGLIVEGIVIDEVVAFVAHHVGSTTAEIDYIAVREDRRGVGMGTTLVATVRDSHPGRAVYAQTDDDAVEFYRSQGFDITHRDPDPRWPERRRYDCVLEPR